jgi:predicted ATPase with chaperone activity
VVRQVLEVSAAGGHHLCLTGPRGADVPGLAAGLVTLLPDLTGQEAAEVTAIYSAAGLLGPGRARITRLAMSISFGPTFFFDSAPPGSGRVAGVLL